MEATLPLELPPNGRSHGNDGLISEQIQRSETVCWSQLRGGLGVPLNVTLDKSLC